MRLPHVVASLCCVLISCLLACSAAADPPPDRVTTRIVSLVPNVTEVLFSIGAGDQVVGTSDFCNYPEEARQRMRVGGLLNPNIERIVSLRPTVVVLLNSQGDVGAKVSRLKVPTLEVRSDSLDDVLGSIAAVGKLTGHTRQAADLTSSIEGHLRVLRDSYAGQARVRTLIIVGRQPASLQNMFAAGPETYLHPLLEAAGGENAVPATKGAYCAITKEQIVQANPDVIIDTSLGEAGANPAVVDEHKRAWAELGAVSAVRNGRVYYFSDPHLTIPGPRLGQTADEIARLLHSK